MTFMAKTSHSQHALCMDYHPSSHPVQVTPLPLMKWEILELVDNIAS